VKRRVALALGALLLCGGALAQEPQPPPPGSTPTQDVTDLVNALLGGLMGGAEVNGERLQEEVAEAGGIPFRQPVPVDFLKREELPGYLKDLFDAEYTEDQARVDERVLRAFDLLPAGTDLRALRARVLEENVAGFYDERPGKRRLYAVSEDRTFSPMNQIVLAHELRHALQDQYQTLDSYLDKDISDFDDRRLAWTSLLEGDATFVMERFLKLRLGSLGMPVGDDTDPAALGAPGLLDVPGAPPVVRDQLVEPYLIGLAFAQALWNRGGPQALRDAWKEPPESTEQVLHPEKYFDREAPRKVQPSLKAPSGSRLVSEGVLGELLLRTLVEEGGGPGTEGWAGDGWRLWDVRGRTALAWRAEWDTAKDAAEFHAALRARLARRGPADWRSGWEVFPASGGFRMAARVSGDAVELASADDDALLERLIR
jgi:hypothetical protein